MKIETARDLAYAVKAQHRPELTPRPWQHQAPDDTLWWLVPSSDWPAYRHGKFVFSLAKDGPRKALIGFNDDVIEASNGEPYYPLAGQRIWLPGRVDDYPSTEFLEWHADTVYRG
jgi:hypothetical protein